MTTKKTTKNDRIKETVENAKKDLTEKKDGFDGCSNTISVSNPKSFVLMAMFIGRKHFTFWAEIACIVTMIIGIYNL